MLNSSERRMMDLPCFFWQKNATWEKLMNGTYRSKFNSKAYLASMAAWIVRYDIKPIFCKEETSGRLIYEFLYRFLKEELESGKYG